MQKLRKILRMFFQVVGLLTILLIVGFFAARFVVQKNKDRTYKKINLNDGPHIFWLNDTTVKVVNITHHSTNDAFEILEFNLNLHDTTSILTTIADELKVEFNPYEEHKINKGSFQADKIAAISDIHGSYNHFVKTMGLWVMI